MTRTPPAPSQRAARRAYPSGLAGVFRTLHAHRGDLHWWPGETPFEVAVGAVLTQNTAWTNVERAIANLKAAGALGPDALDRMAVDDLAALLRPAGYFNVKARRLKALVAFLVKAGGGDPSRLPAGDPVRLRQRLLEVPGVGRETADSILLYAVGVPVFVVDAYTRRIFGRLGLLDPGADYDRLRAAFESALPRDGALWNEYHAQIVMHGKETCRPRPRCGECPLAPGCPAAEVPDTAPGNGGGR